MPQAFAADQCVKRQCNGLVEFKGLGVFILAIALTNLAQYMMHSIWVR